MSSFKVEVYDNYDRPHERRYLPAGEFDTAAKAIARAKSIIRASLERLWHAESTPTQMYAEWANAGDGVRILGVLPIEFSPHEYARARTIGPRSSRLGDRLRTMEERILGW
jgi:hypothetical protein